MLRLLTAVALAVAPSVAAESACLSEDTVTVCLDFGDDWLADAATSCFAGEEPAKSSGVAESTVIALRVQTGVLVKNIYSVVPQLVVASCEGKAVLLALQTALLPLDTGLPSYVSSIGMDATLKVSSKGSSGGYAMAWKGDIVTGSIDNIYVELAVRKSTYDETPLMVVGLNSPASDTTPLLPPVIEFTGDAVSLLTHADTCPFTALAPSRIGYHGATLGIPEAEEPLPVLDGYFDPCLARRIAERNCTEDPTGCTSLNRDVVVSLTASLEQLDRTVAFYGLELEDLEVHVEGTFVWQGDEEAKADGTGAAAANGIHWNGTASALVTLFGNTSLFASADFSATDGLTDLEVAVEYNSTAARVDGVVMWEKDCTSGGNKGDVVLVLPQLNTTVEAEATQTSCSDWNVHGELLGKKLSLFGVALREAVVDLTVSNENGSPSLDGTVSGAVNLGSWVDAQGSVTLEGGRVVDYDVSGTINVDDVVSGNLSATVTEEDVIVGNAFVSVAFGNGEIPALEAQVEYAKASPAGAPVWTVTGSLPSWTLFGVELTEVEVVLTGSRANATAAGSAPSLVWGGFATGKLLLEGSEVEVTVSVADNAFQSMEGDLHVEAANIVFEGRFEVDESSNETGCAGLSYSAAGTLELKGYVFDANLVADGCANVAKSEPLYKLSATVDGNSTLKYGSLALTRAVVELEAYGEACTDMCPASAALSREVASWSGSLVADANVFGGTSTASVVFADGDFQDMYISTIFRTESQLLSGSMDILYTADCTLMSEGTADIRLRLKEAETLNVTGNVAFNTCTGKLDFAGEFLGEWSSPFAVVRLVQVNLSLPEEPAQVSSAIGKRHWTGSLALFLEVGNADTSLTIEVDSLTTETSVVGQLSYETEQVSVGAALVYSSGSGSGPCSGDGSAIVRNLAHGIPSVEADVSVSMKDCGNPAGGWSVSGTVPSFVLPFASKTLNLTSVELTVSRAASDETVSARISGMFASKYFVAVEFNTSSPDSVRVVGGVSAGSPSVGGFLAAWSGGSGALPASLGVGAPELYSDMRAFSLDTVVFQLEYAQKQVVLEATGVLYGLGFDATVVVQKKAGSGNGWLYGVLLEAQDKDAPEPSGLSEALERVVDKLSPNELTFSLASASMDGAGLEIVSLVDGTAKLIRKGLGLSMHLGSDNAVMQEIAGSAPEALREQIAAAGDAAGGITVIVQAESTKHVDAFAMLEGNIELGTPRAVLQTLALNFHFAEGESQPAVGFTTTMWFRVGAAPHDEEFSVTGFLALANGTLSANLTVTNPEPWTDAFGVSGVDVLFPLAVHLQVSQSMVASQFLLSGAAVVGGARGSVVLGADLSDFSKTVVAAGVSGVDLKHMVADLTGCSECVTGLAATLASVSIGSLSVTANPGSADAVDVAIGGAVTTVPAGVAVKAVDVSLWDVIKIASAEFEIESGGVVAEVVAEPVEWGPITITAAHDATRGPSIAFVLVADSHRINLQGMATIWGSSVAVELDLSDKVKHGYFNASVADGIATLDAELLIEGTPGSANFTNVVDGVLSVDKIALAENATQWLVDLQSKADDAFATARKTVDKAESVLSTVQTKLDAVNATWQATLDSWARKVDSLGTKITKMEKNCAKYQSKCDDFPWTACVQFAWCEAKVTMFTVAKTAASASISALKAASRVVIAAAKAAVNAAKAVVSVADGALDVAQNAVDGLLDLAETAGGALTDSLEINYIAFTTTLSPTVSDVEFRGNVNILGKEVTWEFTSDLTLESFTKALITETKQQLAAVWGGVVPALSA